MLLRLASSAACLLLLLAIGPTANAGSVYSDLVIDNTSPVVYWDLDETTGSTASDLVTTTGGANDGTYRGGIQLNKAGPLTSEGYWNMDPANAAPRATANSQAVEYTSLNSTAGVGTAAYSTQVWFNSSVPFTDRTISYIFGRGNGYASGGVDLRDQVFIEGRTTSGYMPNRLNLINGAGSEGGGKLIGNKVLGPDTWYQMLFVRDADNVSVYLNGALEIAGVLPWVENLPSNPAGNGEYISIANRSDFPTANWLGLRGRFDEVAVWDRALSAAEACQLYSAAFAYPSTVMADGPEAYWRMNEITGNNTAVDATGNGHDFTYATQPARTGTGLNVGPRPSEFGGFELDNNAPRLVRSGNQSTYIGIATGVLGAVGGELVNDYTAELWFRLPDAADSDNRGDYLLHRADAGAGSGIGDYMGVVTDAGGDINIFLKAGGSLPLADRLGPTDILPGQWYHLALVRDGDTLTTYLNGNLELDALDMPANAALADWDDGTWTFGNRLDMLTNAQRFNGNIDEIAIYGRVLTEREIKMHYLMAVVPEPSTCVLALIGVLFLLPRYRKKR